MGNCYYRAYTHATDANTPFFTFENVRKKVKVVRVVDGDTVDVVMKSNPFAKVYKYRVRLYGIDAPESKPRLCNPHGLEEIKASEQSRQALERQLTDIENYPTIVFHKNDKYGRLLGTLYGKHGININMWMIQQKYAVSYFGKTKPTFAGTSPSS